MNDESKKNPPTTVSESPLVANQQDAGGTHRSLSQRTVTEYGGSRQEATGGNEKELPAYDLWGRPV